MKRVEFLKKHPPYMVGETAGFSDEKAEALEKQKVVKILGAVKAKRKPVAADAENEALRAQLEATAADLEAAQRENAALKAAQGGKDA